MRSFVFSLDAVLQHRLRLEEEAKRLLADRLADAATLEEELRRLNADLVSATDRLRSGHLVGRIDLAYLTAHRRYTADVTRRGTTLLQRLALAQRSAEEARAKLLEAAKARGAMEKLKEKQHTRWRSDVARRQLAEADDATTRLGIGA